MDDMVCSNEGLNMDILFWIAAIVGGTWALFTIGPFLLGVLWRVLVAIGIAIVFWHWNAK